MKYLFSILILFYSGAGNAQNQIQNWQKLKTDIDMLLVDRNKMAPLNGSVLVAKGGQILTQQFFGYSDKDKNIMIDSSTVFPIASSSKPFTAAAIMLLRERKLISADDPVAAFIPGIPSGWKAVKVKHLLSQTSGIPDIFQVPGAERSAADLPSVLKMYQNRSLQFVPGEKFSYSNVNYILLSYIIEIVSGKPFEEFMSENIFNPLQMRQTGFSWLYAGDHMAKPYINTFKKDTVLAREQANLKVLKGAGGMYSTPADLAKFLSGIRNLLTNESIQVMLKPVKEDYAFGWHIQEQFGKITIKHPGGIPGYVTEMRYVPDDSLVVILLSNVSRNDLVIRYAAFDIMKIINNVPHDVDLAANEKFTGKYKLPAQFAEKAKSSHLEIENQNGRMKLSIPNFPGIMLVAAGKDRYFFYGEPTTAEFLQEGKELLIISPSMGKINCIKE